ncbi:hypothetical protein HGA91_01780 [candidate division WWE3 bacterium]|nr:hypothetical protein [candidate division WWE3 bacterium]
MDTTMSLLPVGFPFIPVSDGSTLALSQSARLQALLGAGVVVRLADDVYQHGSVYRIDHPELIGCEDDWILMACVEQMYMPGRLAAANNLFIVSAGRSGYCPTDEESPALADDELFCEQASDGTCRRFKILAQPEHMPDWLATAYRRQLSAFTVRGFRIFALSSNNESRFTVVMRCGTKFERDMFLHAIRYFTGMLDVRIVNQDYLESGAVNMIIVSLSGFDNNLRILINKIRDAFFYDIVIM